MFSPIYGKPPSASHHFIDDANDAQMSVIIRRDAPRVRNRRQFPQSSTTSGSRPDTVDSDGNTARRCLPARSFPPSAICHAPVPDGGRYIRFVP